MVLRTMFRILLDVLYDNNNNNNNNNSGSVWAVLPQPFNEFGTTNIMSFRLINYLMRRSVDDVERARYL